MINAGWYYPRLGRCLVSEKCPPKMGITKLNYIAFPKFQTALRNAGVTGSSPVSGTTSSSDIIGRRFTGRGKLDGRPLHPHISIDVESDRAKPSPDPDGLIKISLTPPL